MTDGDGSDLAAMNINCIYMVIIGVMLFAAGAAAVAVFS